MDEYDVLLYEINREKRAKELKKFWRGKKWNKKQRKELEKQGKPPLQINMINRFKSGQEIQREQMRGHMGLTDTEGMTITEENMKKLFFELNNCCITGNGGIFSKGVFYEDFAHFAGVLVEKYFTKGGKSERENR